MSNHQMQGKNPDEDSVLVRHRDFTEMKLHERQYAAILRRYPGELSEAKKMEFITEVRGIVPRGRYKNLSGKQAIVGDLSFADGDSLASHLLVDVRPTDAPKAHKEYVFAFVERYLFVIGDAAS